MVLLVQMMHLPLSFLLSCQEFQKYWLVFKILSCFWRCWFILFQILVVRYLLGLLLGFILSIWMLYVRSSDVRHLMTLVFILICAGLSVTLGVSLILSSMVMGIVVGNIRPHRSRSCFVSLHPISTPLYMLFFVLIGARLDYSLLMTMGSVGIIYFSFRMFGKYFGAFTGAYLAKVPSKVRKNIGLCLCLFSQAGVAIGLALSIDLNFRHII